MSLTALQGIQIEVSGNLLVRRWFPTSFELAREVLNYAKELEIALRLSDIFLYRNAKAFLALIIAINAYIKAIESVVPTSHNERRKILRKIGREDLKVLYSDLMKTLRDEVLYEGVY
jgi:hypothetical protein